jgi:hypothetical protein
MTNSETMTLKLRRLDMIDVHMALLDVIFSMQDEMRDTSTTESRRGVLKGSIKKWTALADEVERQFDEQDKDD